MYRQPRGRTIGPRLQVLINVALRVETSKYCPPNKLATVNIASSLIFVESKVESNGRSTALFFDVVVGAGGRIQQADKTKLVRYEHAVATQSQSMP